MLGQARPNSITQVMIYNLGYDLYPRVRNKLLLVVVGLFGMIGNTITISILNRRDMKTPNNFILKGR